MKIDDTVLAKITVVFSVDEGVASIEITSEAMPELLKSSQGAAVVFADIRTAAELLIMRELDA